MYISRIVINHLIKFSPRPQRHVALFIPLLLAGCLALASALVARAAAPAVNLVGINGAACSYPTLADALAAAVDGDTIYLSAATYNETLGSLDLNLSFTGSTNDCTVPDVSGAPSDYVIDGGGVYSPHGGVAAVAAGRSVTFTTMVLRDGLADNGGILYVNGNASATFSRARLEDGVATSDGGLVYVAEQGLLTLTNLTFAEDGIAGDEGGGLYVAGQAVVEQGSIVRAGQAVKGGGVAMTGNSYLELSLGSVGHGSYPNNAQDGGGIYMMDQAHLVVYGGSNVMWNNATAGNGGGIYATGSSLVEIMGTGRVYGNDAPAGFGGGIYADSNARISLNGSTRIGHNTPTWGNNAIRGGGLYLDGIQELRAQGQVSVLNNEAGDFGGGIYLTAGTPMTMTGGQILGNVAGVSGGGLANQAGTITLEQGVVISGNEAMFGGGLSQWNNVDNRFLAWDAAVISNTASVDGGGIYATGGDVAMATITGDGSISGNTAAGNGGGVYADGAALWLRAESPDSHFLIADNTAGLNGGGIYAVNATGTYLIDNVALTGNTALADGGGLYQNGGNLIVASVPQGNFALARPQVTHNSSLNGRGGGLYLDDVSSSPGNPGSLVMNAKVGDNDADSQGGGLYVKGGTYLRLFNSQVENNLATQGAGLMLSNARVYVDQTSVLGAIPGCHNALLPANRYCSEFRNNIAGGNGGAIRMELAAQLQLFSTAVISNAGTLGSALYSSSNGDKVEIVNSLFADNTGKALYTVADVDLELIHSTLANNDWAIDINDNGAQVEMSNSIVWGNGFGVESAAAISGGCAISQNGVGGLAVDPLFHSTGRGDYRLAAGSPAIDACDFGTDIDLDEIPRPIGPKYDMGAFEAGRSLVLLQAQTLVEEGDSGLTPAEVVISLSEPSAAAVTVDVTAVAGTAEEGADFEALATTLNFAPGTISQTVPLNIIGELLYEGDESLDLHLSAVGAVLVVTSTEVVILNDDSLPAVTLEPASLIEGDAGLAAMFFTITLSNPSAFTATIDFFTSDEEGTATAGVDYEDNGGTLTFLPGATTAQVRVWIIGDTLDEVDEEFWLYLDGPEGVQIASGSEEAPGTIIDDDDGGGTEQLFIPMIMK